MLALRPYRGDVLVVGGWAHRLLRLHPLAQGVEFESIRTQDVDLVIPGKIPPRGEELGRLLTQAGFTEHFLGEEQPPVTHYQLGDEATFYAEFLTPLVGPPKAATKEIAGVSAQALRYLDILMIEPWSIQLKEPEYPVGFRALEVRITNATSYLAQKILVLSKRSAADRAKDILYVHDTVLTFGRALTDLHEIWKNTVHRSIHASAAGTLRSASKNLFANVTDNVRGASRIAIEAGRRLPPEEISEVCRGGLEKIFS
jgi:hypothetical protein